MRKEEKEKEDEQEQMDVFKYSEECRVVALP
jgi:hypothetical protein